MIIAYDAHKACLRNKTSEETISIYLYQVVTVLYSESYIFNTISMFYQVISNLCSRRRTDYTVRKTIEYQESTILIYRPKSYLYYQDSRQSWRHTLSTINRYWYKHWVQIKLARVLQNVLNVHLDKRMDRNNDSHLPLFHHMRHNITTACLQPTIRQGLKTQFVTVIRCCLGCITSQRGMQREWQNGEIWENYLSIYLYILNVEHSYKLYKLFPNWYFKVKLYIMFLHA